MIESGDQEAVLVPISAIEHWSYCPRQCGLIHLEKTFDENLYTIRGQLAHERVDTMVLDAVGPAGVLRSVPLWSDRLGLTGRADVVEMRGEGPYPVEYKVGPPLGRHAVLQLCAQAMCLEEMTGAQVCRGATFHLATRRRQEVEFDVGMRHEVEGIVAEIRSMLESSRLPGAVADRRCRKCSLVDSCQPDVLSDPAGTAAWDEWLFSRHDSEEEP